MAMTTQLALVIDTNHKEMGQQEIKVDFHYGKPTSAVYDGKLFIYTGKDATGCKEYNMNRDVFELADADDRRIWLTAASG